MHFLFLLFDIIIFIDIIKIEKHVGVFMKKGLLRASLILSLIVGAICGGVFGVYSYAILPWVLAFAKGQFNALYFLLVAAICGLVVFIFSIITLAKLGRNDVVFRGKGVAIVTLVFEVLFMGSAAAILISSDATINSSSMLFYIAIAVMGLIAILTLIGTIKASRVARLSPAVTNETEEQ